MCAGWKGSGSDPSLLGVCLDATVRYTPSLSTRIGCASCDDVFGPVAWVVANDSDAWTAKHGWPVDPMWAESDWPADVPFVQLYLLKPWGVRVRSAVELSCTWCDCGRRDIAPAHEFRRRAPRLARLRRAAGSHWLRRVRLSLRDARLIAT